MGKVITVWGSPGSGKSGIVKKTAHPTCPVMPPVLVLTATVSA